MPRKIQELLLVEGKSTRKEYGDGTLVPTSDVTSCSNEQFLSFRTSLESGFTTMGESLTKAIKDCFTTVVEKLNPRDQDGYNIVIKGVLIQTIPLWNKRYCFSLFKKGLGFSALTTAETALSCIIQPKNMVGLDTFFRDQVFEMFADLSESMKICNETFGILCL